MVEHSSADELLFVTPRAFTSNADEVAALLLLLALSSLPGLEVATQKRELTSAAPAAACAEGWQ